MSPEFYLQVISILIAVVAVVVPFMIIVVGFVYIRRFTERIEILSGEVDELWDRIEELGQSRPDKPAE